MSIALSSLRRLIGSRGRELTFGLVVSVAFIGLNVLRAGPFDFSEIEVAAFVTGAWSVWLCVRNDIWNWPAGVANGGIFVWLFFDARLYADAGINAFYVVAGLYGWWFWARGGASRTPRAIGRASLREWLLLVAGMIVGSWWMYGHLVSLHDSAPLLDAITTAVSIAAFWMQARRYIDQWFLWIAVDLVYVPLYIWKALPLTGALYVLFLAMCVVGLRDWIRQLDSARSPKVGPRRVVVLGAESTGKSTLARDLAAALSTVWVPEYGRTYTEALPDPAGHVWCEADFVAIAEGQLAHEDAACASAVAPVVVLDTDAYVTALFCESYTGRRSRTVEQLAASRRYDLYLVCDPSTPFRQDENGTRRLEQRAFLHERELAYARRSGSTVELSGSPAERVTEALGAIGQMLSA